MGKLIGMSNLKAVNLSLSSSYLHKIEEVNRPVPSEGGGIQKGKSFPDGSIKILYSGICIVRRLSYRVLTRPSNRRVAITIIQRRQCNSISSFLSPLFF